MKKITPFAASLVLSVISLFASPLCCLAQVSAESKKIAAEYRDNGLRAQKNGDLETALVYFQKAIEIDPTLAVAYNDAGVIYEAKGWNDRAKLAYGKAIDLDPTLPSPYYNLGSIYEREGDLEKAAYYFKKRVLIGEWNDEWTIKARQELKSLGISDPEIRADFLDQHLAGLESKEDVNLFPRGNDLDPRRRKRRARMHLLKGKKLYYMGQYAEALKELGAAAAEDPRNREVLRMLEEVQHKALTNN